MSSADESRSALDLLDLPEPLQQLVRWMRQHPSFTRAEVTEQVGEPDTAEALLTTLIDQGFLEPVASEMTEAAESESPRYRLHLSHRAGRNRRTNLWQSLDDPTDHE